RGRRRHDRRLPHRFPSHVARWPGGGGPGHAATDAPANGASAGAAAGAATDQGAARAGPPLVAQARLITLKKGSAMSSMIVRFESAGGARWGLLVSDAPTRPEDRIQVREIASDAATTGQLIASLESGRPLPQTGETRTIPAGSLMSPVTSDGT